MQADIATVTSIELPYDWRHSPWVLNVPNDCIKDLAVAVMHQAILDAKAIGKQKSFSKRKPISNGHFPVMKENREDFLDWIFSPQFELIADVIDGWDLRLMRRKLEDVLN